METHQESGAGWNNITPVATNGDASADKIPGENYTAPSEFAFVASSAEKIGSIIGNRYLLQTELGEGHLGTRFAAVDQQLTQAGQRDHRVLVEILTLRSEQDQQRARLANRFLDLVALSHPNLSRIIDFGMDGSTVFLVTELLEGTSLDSILSGNSNDAFSEGEVLAVVRGIGDALQYMHDNVIVHGNLRPESIFITEDFEVKLTDLAAVVMTRTFGNIDAQRVGDSQTLKPTTDVFGLAAVTYELLANEPPYDGLPRGHARKKELKVQRIKGVSRRQWSALSHALRLQPVKRTPSIETFVSEFGVIGSETLSDAVGDDQESRRNWLRPAVLMLAAAAGAVVLLQSNTVDVGNLVDSWRDRLSGQVQASGTVVQDVAALPATENDVLVETTPEPQELVAASEEVPLGTAPVSALNAEAPPVQGASDTSQSDPTPDTLLTDAVPIDAVRTDDTMRVVAEGLPQPDASSVVTGFDVAAGEAQQSDEAVVAESAPAPVATADPVDSRPVTVSFRQASVTVTEDQGMVPIVIERRGSNTADTSIIWWTADNTATANRDYAELGVRTENIAIGSDSTTVYVPLVSDSVTEQNESFFVFAGPERAPKSAADRLEVFVRDDDR